MSDAATPAAGLPDWAGNQAQSGNPGRRGRGAVVLMLQLAPSVFTFSLAPSAGRKKYCRQLGNVCNYVFIMNHYTRQAT